MMLVFLVGMMGSGKTTIGKLLSDELQLPFYDTDDIITNIEGSPIGEIFDHHGEAYFRSLEKELISSWKMTNCIVATGGGLPCVDGVMDILKTKGITVYLNCSVEVLRERLDSDVTRPLLIGKNKDEKTKLIKNMLNERKIFYNQAKIKVKNDLKAEDVVNKILLKLKRK